MAGVVTVKTRLELLGTEFTVIVTGPVVTLDGVSAVMEETPQLEIDAAGTPLKLTVLVPCVLPKLLPVIVTGAPGTPDVGDRVLMFGVAITVKFVPALVRVFCLTVRLCAPGYALRGIVAWRDVWLQLVAATEKPEPITCGAESYEFPKFVPLTVIMVPAAPLEGDILVIVGVCCTLKTIELLATPLTVTNKGPLVAAVGT